MVVILETNSSTNVTETFCFQESHLFAPGIQVVSQRSVRTDEQSFFSDALRTIADQYDDAFRKFAD